MVAAQHVAAIADSHVVALFEVTQSVVVVLSVEARMVAAKNLNLFRFPRGRVRAYQLPRVRLVVLLVPLDALLVFPDAQPLPSVAFQVQAQAPSLNRW